MAFWVVYTSWSIAKTALRKSPGNCLATNAVQSAHLLQPNLHHGPIQILNRTLPLIPKPSTSRILLHQSVTTKLKTQHPEQHAISPLHRAGMMFTRAIWPRKILRLHSFSSPPTRCIRSLYTGAGATAAKRPRAALGLSRISLVAP